VVLTLGTVTAGLGVAKTLAGLFADSNPENLTGQLRRVYAVGGTAEFGAALVKAVEKGDNQAGERAQQILAKTNVATGHAQRAKPSDGPRHCAGFNLWVATINGLLGRVRGVSGFQGCDADDDAMRTAIGSLLRDAGLEGFIVFRGVEELVATGKGERAVALIESIHDAVGVRAVDTAILRESLGLAQVPTGLTEDEARDLRGEPAPSNGGGGMGGGDDGGGDDGGDDDDGGLLKLVLFVVLGLAGLAVLGFLTLRARRG